MMELSSIVTMELSSILTMESMIVEVRLIELNQTSILSTRGLSSMVSLMEWTALNQTAVDGGSIPLVLNQLELPKSPKEKAKLPVSSP